jgi:outer membrane protein insertion porin family
VKTKINQVRLSLLTALVVSSAMGSFQPVRGESNNPPATPSATGVEIEGDAADLSNITAQLPTGERESQAQTPPPEETPPQPSPENEPRVLVAEIQVEGVEGELEDVVFQAIDTRPGQTTTRSQLQEDVNAVFATGFFSNVRVDPEDTPLGVRITFVVEPNPVLQDVSVQTVPADVETRVLPPEVVDEIFGEQYGEILNLRELQEDIERLNEWYRERGYDLAQVVGAPEVSPDGTVQLFVAEGVIEEIRVRYFDEEDEILEEGGRTREFIITREIQLDEGQVFNRELAQRDLQRVFGLGLFQDVRLSFDPGEDPTQVVINVDVVESDTGSVAAGAGLSSATGLFGTISYQQQNLGGNNQNLGAELQLGQRQFLFNVRFTDPWIAGDDSRTSYTVQAFRRRNISLIFEGPEDDIDINGDRPRIVRTGADITFARPLIDNVFEEADWILSAGLNYQRVSVQDGDGDEVDPANDVFTFSGEGNDDLALLEFGAVRDLRDNRLQPTSGSLLRLNVDQSIPVGTGSILFNRLRASYSYFTPFELISFNEEQPSVLAFNVQGGTVLGDLPPYEAFSLGGTNSVRGYDEGEVGSGRSYIQATAEYRFPLFAVLTGAAFLDYGTDLGTADDVPGEPANRLDKPGNGFGYGLGVRVQSPLGPIRVDYALNDEGDSRIHFGIGERF